MKIQKIPFITALSVMAFLSSFISAQSGGAYDIGLAAEDVAKAAPFFAFRNKEGVVEGVRYERLNMVLINAVKEQQAQIEDQSSKIEDQSSKIKAQQKQIDALTRLVCASNKGADICKEQ